VASPLLVARQHEIEILAVVNRVVDWQNRPALKLIWIGDLENLTRVAKDDLNVLAQHHFVKDLAACHALKRRFADLRLESRDLRFLNCLCFQQLLLR
jgi:hypothetical protein